MLENARTRGMWTRALVVLAHAPALAILAYLLVPVLFGSAGAIVVAVPLALVVGGLVAWRRGQPFVTAAVDVVLGGFVALLTFVAGTFGESVFADPGFARVSAAFVASLFVGAGMACLVDGRHGAIRGRAWPVFAVGLAMAVVWVVFVASKFPA
jgi:hypothetical protein